MKTKRMPEILQAIAGMGTEVFYALLIMLAAFIVGAIILAIK